MNSMKLRTLFQGLVIWNLQFGDVLFLFPNNSESENNKSSY